MKAYLARRFLLIIPSLLGISLITFSLLQFMPGTPGLLRLQKLQGTMSSNVNSEAIIEQTKKMYGLDKPIWKQYGLWVWRMCRLDFGTSFKDHRPVRLKIAEAIPITLQLNIISLLLVYLISIPIGVYSATHEKSFADTLVTLLLFLLYSIPSFWIAMLLIYSLCGGQFLNWFPSFGLSSLGSSELSWGPWLLDRAWHLVLPVFCLTYVELAFVSRFARSGMIDVIRQDYIRTARAYGFSERAVIFKYAMRNSLIPILTLVGALLPELIGGSVIIEQIFSVPGMGRLAFEAVLGRDYPLVMGILAISALLTLIGLIVSDILYAVTDPRIKFE